MVVTPHRWGFWEWKWLVVGLILMGWASYCWSPYEPKVDMLIYNFALFFVGFLVIATMLEKLSGWWTFGFIVLVELISLFSSLPLPVEKRTLEFLLAAMSGMVLGVAYLFRWMDSTTTRRSPGVRKLYQERASR